MDMKKSAGKKMVRADMLLVGQSCLSLEDCRKRILAGLIRLNKDHVIRNPSELIPSDIVFIINDQKQYVSRGAYKIKAAIEKYANDLSDLIAADIGASTGGFTDLMLQHGIKKVYAIDVGYGQLHYRLQKDNRVVSMERVNARNLTENSIPVKVDIFTMDVSFISVTRILKNVDAILKTGGLGFILIKPQFEAEPGEVDKGGVVKNEEVIRKYIDAVSVYTEQEVGWENIDLQKSPILGPKGNQEYVLIVRKKP